MELARLGVLADIAGGDGTTCRCSKAAADAVRDDLLHLGMKTERGGDEPLRAGMLAGGLCYQ
ncbi:hypothetical protein EBU58_15065, partial [bacterium]|nr:hypothetical protein [bacterium]